MSMSAASSNLETVIRLNEDISQNRLAMSFQTTSYGFRMMGRVH